MNTTGKIIAAFVAGTAAGALLGILFAPAKGSETRKKISDCGCSTADAIKEKFSRAKEKYEGIKKEMEGNIKETEKDFF